ncbi:MAG: hypothetical protein JWP51_5577 [Bradyrhizobium sp.]|jgi:hypothetical protein|nr:hypothetical protein [Bradyrhizobium sp.]
MPAFIEPAGWRLVGDLPAAFEPAVAIKPMTGKHRRWRPALARCRRVAKPRQVVIAIRAMGKPGLVQPRRDALGLNRPEFHKSGFCESFEHRSPPLPRFTRQASERDSQPGATIPLTRRRPARLILMSCGSAGPIMVAGLTLPKVVLPMCSSLGLNGLSRTNALDNNRQVCLTCIAVKHFFYPPRRIIDILPGG